MKTKTFAIIPGLGEGRLISRRMKQAFKARGWQAAPADQATVIITHSAGIYGLPRRYRAQLLVHLNCSPYMTYGQLFTRHLKKIAYDYQRRASIGQRWRWLLALLANGWYLCDIPRGLRLRRGFLQSAALLGELPAGRHIFVGGQNDSLSDASDILSHTANNHTYLSIKGGHDDCWREPDHYIATVEQLARQAAGSQAQTEPSPDLSPAARKPIMAR